MLVRSKRTSKQLKKPRIKGFRTAILQARELRNNFFHKSDNKKFRYREVDLEKVKKRWKSFWKLCTTFKFKISKFKLYKRGDREGRGIPRRLIFYKNLFLNTFLYKFNNFFLDFSENRRPSFGFINNQKFNNKFSPYIKHPFFGQIQSTLNLFDTTNINFYYEKVLDIRTIKKKFYNFYDPIKEFHRKKHFFKPIKSLFGFSLKRKRFFRSFFQNKLRSRKLFKSGKRFLDESKNVKKNQKYFFKQKFIFLKQFLRFKRIFSTYKSLYSIFSSSHSINIERIIISKLLFFALYNKLYSMPSFFSRRILFRGRYQKKYTVYSLVIRRKVFPFRFFKYRINRHFSKKFVKANLLVGKEYIAAEKVEFTKASLSRVYKNSTLLMKKKLKKTICFFFRKKFCKRTKTKLRVYTLRNAIYLGMTLTLLQLNLWGGVRFIFLCFRLFRSYAFRNRFIPTLEYLLSPKLALFRRKRDLKKIQKLKMFKHKLKKLSLYARIASRSLITFINKRKILNDFLFLRDKILEKKKFILSNSGLKHFITEKKKNLFNILTRVPLFKVQNKTRFLHSFFRINFNKYFLHHLLYWKNFFRVQKFVKKYKKYGLWNFGLSFLKKKVDRLSHLRVSVLPINMSFFMNRRFFVGTLTNPVSHTNLYTSFPARALRRISIIVGPPKAGIYTFLSKLKKKKYRKNDYMKSLIVRDLTNRLYDLVHGNLLALNIKLEIPRFKISPSVFYSVTHSMIGKVHSRSSLFKKQKHFNRSLHVVKTRKKAILFPYLLLKYFEFKSRKSKRLNTSFLRLFFALVSKRFRAIRKLIIFGIYFPTTKLNLITNLILTLRKNLVLCLYFFFTCVIKFKLLKQQNCSPTSQFIQMTNKRIKYLNSRYPYKNFLVSPRRSKEKIYKKIYVISRLYKRIKFGFFKSQRLLFVQSFRYVPRYSHGSPLKPPKTKR